MAAGADPGLLATRVINDLAVDDWSAVAASDLAELIGMESGGRLSASQSKRILAEMAESGEGPEEVALRLRLQMLAGEELTATIDRVIAGNPDEWQRFCSGDDADRKRLAGFFIGQVMRATKGRADGAAVNRLLQERAVD